MRISHEHKFIFLSKPRCASESIRRMLDNYSDIKGCNRLPFRNHISALELKRFFEKVKWDWDEYFKCITIRNPWEMMVSVYHYSKPDINGIYYWENKKKGIKYQPDNPIGFDKWIKNHTFNFWTLERFILDENGESLVDLIIKVEELSAGLKRFFDKVHLPFQEIPHINASRHGDYREYYSIETRETVRKAFQYDIEVGGYEF